MYRGEYILKAKPVQDIEECAVILGRYTFCYFAGVGV